MIAFAHESRHLAEIYDRVSDFQFEGGKRLVERLGLEEISEACLVPWSVASAERAAGP